VIDGIKDIEKYDIELIKMDEQDKIIMEYNKMTNKGIEKKYSLGNINKIIMANKDTSDITKLTYKNNIKMAFKVIDAEDFDEIIKDIEGYKLKMEERYKDVGTQKALIVIIGLIYKYINGKDDNRIMEILNEKDDKIFERQEMRRKEVIEIERDELRGLIRLKEDIMIKLILKLTVEYPRRDDYSNIKIIREDNEIKDMEEYDGYYNKNEYKIILRKYKTAKVNKKDDIIIIKDKELKEIIDETFNKYPDRKLLIEKRNGERYKLLGDIVKKELGITLNMMRKILTKELGTSMASKELGHSKLVSQIYYKMD
jgi:hypothetical protein